jgi:hypothetical protein
MCILPKTCLLIVAVPHIFLQIRTLQSALGWVVRAFLAFQSGQLGMVLFC